MNCKPEDLAVIVSATCAENRNRIVQILKPGGVCEYGPMWLVECATPLTVMRPGLDGRWYSFKETRACVPDAWMRPIRDPGPDAVDEVIQRVGVPWMQPA